MDEVNLEEVVGIVRAAGVTAVVGESGDGSATVYVGELRGDGRVTALAGPGWFAGPGLLNPRADSLDFVVRRDDDGVTRGVYCRDARSAAEALLAIAREREAGPAHGTGDISEIVDVEEDSAVIPWGVDAIQFPRLLAELHASVELTDEQWMALCHSTGLQRSDIEGLFERADRTWQAIRAGTRGQG